LSVPAFTEVHKDM